MEINNINFSQGTIWNGNNAAIKSETVDLSNSINPAILDKLVLEIPDSETIYKRQEFVTDESMGEGCAFCYTYMERTLASGLSVTSYSSSDGYFILNADKSGQTFGRSGADMNNIKHAVEETYERIDRTSKQSTISGSLSGTAIGGSLEFAAQSTAYKYKSVRDTQGSVAYKNGGAEIYREKAVSSLEIYNKCAVFLEEAFGDKNDGLVIDSSEFNKLFDKQCSNEKTSPEAAEQNDKNINERLMCLKRFMERNLSAVRKKSPDCGSLKTFLDTYTKLGAYNYADIISIAGKMFASGKTV